MARGERRRSSELPSSLLLLPPRSWRRRRGSGRSRRAWGRRAWRTGVGWCGGGGRGGGGEADKKKGGDSFSLARPPRRRLAPVSLFFLFGAVLFLHFFSCQITSDCLNCYAQGKLVPSFHSPRRRARRGQQEEQVQEQQHLQQRRLRRQRRRMLRAERSPTPLPLLPSSPPGRASRGDCGGSSCRPRHEWQLSAKTTRKWRGKRLNCSGDGGDGR